MDIVYYAERCRDGRFRIVCDVIGPYTMLGDNLLFDSPEDCIQYWSEQGISVER